MEEKNAFISLVKQKISSASSEAYLGLLAIIGILLFMLYAAATTGILMFLIPVIVIGYFVYRLTKREKGTFKGSFFWGDLIEKNPDEIVWIKPILTSHTAAFVITLYKEQSFQLYTKSGLHVKFKVSSQKDLETFYKGLQTHLPHAHLGYSEKVKEAYFASKDSFISSLKNRKIYQPVSSFDFED